MKCVIVSCWIGRRCMQYWQRLGLHFLLQFQRMWKCQPMKTADRYHQYDDRVLCFEYRHRQNRWIGKFVSNIIVDQIHVQTDLGQLKCVMTCSPEQKAQCFNVPTSSNVWKHWSQAGNLPINETVFVIDLPSIFVAVSAGLFSYFNVLGTLGSACRVFLFGKFAFYNLNIMCVFNHLPVFNETSFHNCGFVCPGMTSR